MSSKLKTKSKRLLKMFKMNLISIKRGPLVEIIKDQWMDQMLRKEVKPKLLSEERIKSKRSSLKAKAMTWCLKKGQGKDKFLKSIMERKETNSSQDHMFLKREILQIQVKQLSHKKTSKELREKSMSEWWKRRQGMSSKEGIMKLGKLKWWDWKI